jgi:hypothetical protein
MRSIRRVSALSAATVHIRPPPYDRTAPVALVAADVAELDRPSPINVFVTEHEAGWCSSMPVKTAHR